MEIDLKTPLLDLFAFFQSTNTLIELALVIAVSLIGLLVHRQTRPRLLDYIAPLSLPYRAKEILKSLTKLVWPGTVMVLLFITAQIMQSETMAMQAEILKIVLNLLGAWIIIRIALQLIENAFVRNIIAMTVWTIAALSIFGILDQTTSALDSVALTFGEFRLSALAVIKGAFAIFTLMYLAIFTSSFAERRIFLMSSFSRPTQVLLAKIVRISLIVVALLIGITSAGIDLSLFAVFGGAIGLGIGFGLQKGISNLFSGMLLLTDQSIKPGDVIEMPELQTFGWVNKMAARYTEIVTRDNKSVLIPNEDFITQRVINWSHENSLVRVKLPFGVHYDSNPHEVSKIAIEAAKSVQRVVPDRDPVCWITEFGDSSINFDLRFWIKDAHEGIGNIRGHVYLALWDAFKEHDIKIPYPHREIFVTEGKP